jgi:hypothetical protein
MRKKLARVAAIRWRGPGLGGDSTARTQLPSRLKSKRWGRPPFMKPMEALRLSPEVVDDALRAVVARSRTRRARR